MLRRNNAETRHSPAAWLALNTHEHSLTPVPTLGAARERDVPSHYLRPLPNQAGIPPMTKNAAKPQATSLAIPPLPIERVAVFVHGN